MDWKPLSERAEVAHALGQVVLVLADDGQVGVEALQQRVERGRVLADEAVGLARHGVDVGDQVGQVLVVGGQAGGDRVEVVDDGEQLLVPRRPGCDDSVLAESISCDTWPLRWSTVVVSAPSPSMIWATWVCLSLVMVASEVTRLLSALRVRLGEERVRRVLQLVELGGHRGVGDQCAGLERVGPAADRLERHVDDAEQRLDLDGGRGDVRERRPSC